MSLKVANTILAQLGGNRFVAMTGARNLLGDDHSLQMKIGKNSKRVTNVRVALNTLDLYDITFYNVRGLNVKTVSEARNVYGDCLQGVFTSHTGLDTHL